jgi:hypothetical protein
MAEPFGVHFEVTGPVFDGTGLRVMQGIINRGLFDIAVLEGANKVKDQLYGPPASQYWKADPKTRHGAKSRDLKRRVAASQPSDNLAIFNAGGIHYAPKIEALYGMFEKATAAIERDKAALYHKYIGGALIEAFD